MQHNLTQDNVSALPKLRIVILVIFFPITIYFVIGSALYGFKNYIKRYNQILWEKITEKSKVSEQSNNQNGKINKMVILMFPILILPHFIYELISFILISSIFSFKSSINIINNLISFLTQAIILILSLPFITLYSLALQGWNLIVKLYKLGKFIINEIWEGVKVIFGF